MSEVPAPNNEYLKKLYGIENWQLLHVQQLAYTRNLFIVLSSAALGYTLSLPKSDNVLLYATFFKVICVLYLTSIAFGSLIAYQESRNYRLKYAIARNIERSLSFSNEESKCSRIESLNRCLILIQLILFTIAIFAETLLLLI